MKKIYIATVGTGTAGKHSNLGQGLLNTIKQANPDYLYFISSQNEASEELGKLVLEESGLPGEVFPYFDNPDDLLACRAQCRRCMNSLRNIHPQDELILNPTSGTKQMTSAAILAAVDTACERIEYISGERFEGVIKTGTERIAPVSGRKLLAEFTLRDAHNLINAGAYHGAAELLRQIRDLYSEDHDYASSVAAWNRFDYTTALEFSSGFPTEQQVTLKKLTDAPDISLIRCADMSAFIKRAINFGQNEEALAVLYRQIEALAKLRLQELGCDMSAPSLAEINATINPPQKLYAKLKSIEQYNGSLQLGLQLSLELLKPTHFPLADRYFNNHDIRRIAQLRNQTRYGHGLRHAPPEDVKKLNDAVYQTAKQQWPDFPKLVSQCQFPEQNGL